MDDAEFRIQPEKVDLHELINTIVSNKELELDQQGVELTIDLTADNHSVMADKLHLSNVIYNLLDNAIKYRKENPAISISTINTEEDLVLTIKDNGIGISEEHQRHLFKKFFRVPTGNVHNVKGFGLGLHYVKRIIDQHKWQIHVDSRLGVGTEM